MSPYICKTCNEVYKNPENGKCPSCGNQIENNYDFSNSDKYLREKIPLIQEMRKNIGLEGLVGGLDSVIINTEPQNQQDAVIELEKYTGLKYKYGFEDTHSTNAILQTPDSANFIIKSRKKDENPFLSYNKHPKSEHIPNSRLETFVFHVSDIYKYHLIQRERDVEFMTESIQDFENYSFIQTKPSKYLGLSYGFIEWKNPKVDYHPNEFKELLWDLEHPQLSHQKNIHRLDHTASRVKAPDRDAAILEFMELTNYDFNFAIYVKHLNSITSVARVSANDFAMVFTSGINPYETYEAAGPTERYIHNYGTRTHHMAFRTENIEDTFSSLEESGMGFLVDLVGSKDEGLKQTFSVQSPNTLLVNEYIHRYGDFDGFFTKSNVSDLTKATEKQ